MADFNGGPMDAAVEPLVDILYNLTNSQAIMAKRHKRLQVKLSRLPIKVTAINYLK